MTIFEHLRRRKKREENSQETTDPETVTLEQFGQMLEETMEKLTPEQRHEVVESWLKQAGIGPEVTIASTSDKPEPSKQDARSTKPVRPILKKIILPAGRSLSAEERLAMAQFERAEDFRIEEVRSDAEFLRALGYCVKCGKGFTEEGFYLDVFGQKYCPDCYEQEARRPH